MCFFLNAKLDKEGRGKLSEWGFDERTRTKSGELWPGGALLTPPRDVNEICTSYRDTPTPPSAAKDVRVRLLKLDIVGAHFNLQQK